MFAIGLLLLWIAGVAFFAAFHPGGVTNPDGSAASNPADIIKWLMVKGGEGANASTSAGGGTSDPNAQTT